MQYSRKVKLQVLVWTEWNKDIFNQEATLGVNRKAACSLTWADTMWGEKRICNIMSRLKWITEKLKDSGIDHWHQWSRMDHLSVKVKGILKPKRLQGFLVSPVVFGRHRNCIAPQYFPEIYAGSNLYPSSMISPFHQRQTRFAKGSTEKWDFVSLGKNYCRYLIPKHLSTLFLSKYLFCPVKDDNT